MYKRTVFYFIFKIVYVSIQNALACRTLSHDAYLEEASDGGGAALVTRHARHHAARLDVAAACVVRHTLQANHISVVTSIRAEVE